MLAALETFGVGIKRTEQPDGSTTVVITPADQLNQAQPDGSALRIECGLAGTVMRFVPPLAAVAKALVHFDGDPAARLRPMAPVLDGLGALGATFDYPQAKGMLPFTIDASDVRVSDTVIVDASGSSQFVSALLLAGHALPGGLRLRAADGPVASPDHIMMTVQTLREMGVEISVDADSRGWRISEGSIDGFTVTVEPDLSNAGPFLAAALASNGSVGIRFWPQQTTQVGGKWVQILKSMGAEVEHGADSVLTVRGTGKIKGITYADASELAPTLAALCVLADSPSKLTGIGHLRGHETDRLAALETELAKVGATVKATEDTLEIIPGSLHAADLHSYEDHRMATAGALLGLAIDGIRVENIATTAKTMPQFPQLWAQMVDTSKDRG